MEAARDLSEIPNHNYHLLSSLEPLAGGDVAIGQGDRTRVGNGDTMNVSAEIAQHTFSAARRVV
jgi:hypothetical protein